MKSLVAAVSLLVLMTMGLLLWQRHRPSVPTPGKKVGVESLMNDSEKYRGTIRVAGMVGQVAAGKQLFSLVDQSDADEFKREGSTKCVMLPVRWSGKMPRTLESVSVSGQIAKQDGKLVFVASSIEKADLK